MKLCDYGCGQEAKYPITNGKWCCSKSYNSCPVNRKKNSMKVKEAHKDANSKYNSISCRKKHSIILKEARKNPDSIYNSNSYRVKRSNIMKELWDDPDSIYNSDLYKEKISDVKKKEWKDPNSVFNSILFRKKISDNTKKSHRNPNSGFNSISCKEKRSQGLKDSWKNLNSGLHLIKLTIEKVNDRYPFFSKIEEMRYKPEEKEIQVHCKNHECENSKEKDGWFTPTYNQLRYRIGALENPKGNGESNFYCSQRCKDTCLLYGVRSDPYKDNNLSYTPGEIQTLNKFVLKRENYLCEYCGEHATIVHHIRPKKLEPFFALDPDYAIAVCIKHHFKYGHQGECSTGNLAKIVCSAELQKFLNQK